MVPGPSHDVIISAARKTMRAAREASCRRMSSNPSSLQDKNPRGGYLIGFERGFSNWTGLGHRASDESGNRVKLRPVTYRPFRSCYRPTTDRPGKTPTACETFGWNRSDFQPYVPMSLMTDSLRGNGPLVR